MKRRILAALIVSACALSCAFCAHLPLKQQAVVGLQASETALEAAHDAERALCSPTADKTKPITHCDGLEAATLGLTDARHQALARAFSKAFDAEIKAAIVLKAWKAGDPAPTDVAGYIADVNAVLALAQQIFPSAQLVAVKAQTSADEAAKVAKIVGVQ